MARRRTAAAEATAEYELYYWSVPFRGQFVRAVLAYAGKGWSEAGDGAIGDLMEGPVARMPVPFMGPPVLVDRRAGFAVSQMPAILLYLGETLGLLPDTPAPRAMTLKVINDANDLIDDLTLDGGRAMWTARRWREFVPRLRRWMAIWEETGRRHGLAPGSGTLLGGESPRLDVPRLDVPRLDVPRLDAPGLADIVTATLWSTLSGRFPTIGALLDETAPMTAALTQRIASLPALAALEARARRDFGDAYCGGRIERSLRKVLGD